MDQLLWFLCKGANFKIEINLKSKVFNFNYL